jgi:16S rRNA (cytidine1402-2'-O)-methyltransferase
LSGTLYIVSTPIGNLEDLAPRALSTLAAVHLVACEDTRRTGLLLSKVGVKNSLLSLHEHNEERRLPYLIAKLDAGLDVALVSDAGTPLLSDPGYTLVRAAVERDVPVVAIPGPSAVLTALVVSGLPPYPFTFVGFIPPKKGKRRRFFARFESLDHTLVAFESPRRLVQSLTDAAEIFGDRPAAVARELTKLHEETLRGRLNELAIQLGSRPAIKGEVCLVIGTGRAARGGSKRSR